VDGYWQGQETFSFNLALYYFSFSNLIIDPTHWYKLITSINYLLAPVARNMSNLNLATNLLYLQVSNLPYIHNGYTQVISFAPIPGVVYQRAYIAVYFSSAVDGVCPYSTQGYMLSANANLQTTIVNKSFVEYCGNSTSLAVMGYDNSLIDNVAFNIFVDFNTVVIALGANYGMLNISSSLESISLTSTAAQFESFTYNGISYRATQYYDPDYPGMAPTICLTSDTGYPICFVRLNGYFLLPFSNSLGGPNAHYYNVPQYCDW
jgi:hypothetical protein